MEGGAEELSARDRDKVGLERDVKDREIGVGSMDDTGSNMCVNV